MTQSGSPQGILAATGRGLPHRAPVCYKQLYAQMDERALEAPQEARRRPVKEATKAPEPLQPRFYDNEPDAPPAAPVAAPVVESPRRPRERNLSRRAAPEPVSAAAASSQHLRQANRDHERRAVVAAAEVVAEVVRGRRVGYSRTRGRRRNCRDW